MFRACQALSSWVLSVPSANETSKLAVLYGVLAVLYAAHAAYFVSIGLLLACQVQDWKKHIEMGDEGSVVLLQIPHFVG